MHQLLRGFILATVVLSAVALGQETPRKEYTRADAERMIRAAEGTLAPVYAPLAQEMVERLNLADKEGIGVDLGSGPGSLILELCRQTKLHWINADINPHFFPYFFKQAEAAGMSGRVSAIQADACALPLRDNLADVIVSRGSLQFWPDLPKGLAEIQRVLKPGAVAYIGRGLPEKLPPEAARKLREGQGESLKYDPDKAEQQLRDIMRTLGIADYRIYRPRPEGAEGLNYGVWLQFRKASP
jgi:SAM-dependent methyltransferase